MTPGLLSLLAFLRFEAAVLSTGYLIAGWRGMVVALAVREAIPLLLRLILP